MSSGVEAWRVRAYQPGDERAIVRLFEEALGRPITEEYWRWKFITQPSSVDTVGLAIGADNSPVFHIGGIPCRFQSGADQLPIMVAVDAMTAPQYRRRGLLRTVGGATFDQWRLGGVAMALGLPNEQYNKAALGWQSLFALKWAVCLLRPEAVLARRLGRPALARWSGLGRLWSEFWARRMARDRQVVIREVTAAGPEFDLVWRHCASAIRFTLVRDRRWVAWRYFAAPHTRYHVLLAQRAGVPIGYAAYRLKGDGDRMWGIIAEVFARPGDVAVVDGLVGEAVRRLRGEEAVGLATLVIPGTGLQRALRRAGFLFSWGAFSVECVPFDPGIRLEDLRNPGAWVLAGGDFDVV